MYFSENITFLRIYVQNIDNLKNYYSDYEKKMFITRIIKDP